jgi:hypothetical protein
MKTLSVPLVAALLLAGCATDDATPTPPGAADADGPAPPAEAPWTLTACLHAVWYAEAPAAPLQARVPEGFLVRAGPSGTAPLGFEAFVCESGHGLWSEVAGLQYGSLFIGVDPPDEYGCDDLSGGCYVKTDVLVPDAGRRAWLQAAGVAAHNGTAGVTVDAAGTWTTSLVMEDVGGFGMQGVPAGPPRGSAGAGLPFMEFMSATGGVSVWKATTADASQTIGAGAWSADPGTWVASEVALVGPTNFSAGTWSFVDGTVSVPAG